jgi:hypothetical protein
MRIARCSGGGRGAFAAAACTRRDYREPLRITRATLAHLDAAAAGLAGNPATGSWRAKVCRYRPLVEHAQTERRVPAGEAVPASDKLVSLFRAACDGLTAAPVAK